MDDQNPPPRPGNYERSWNDPPLFSYASGTQASTETKKAGGNKLNKRVGHSIANTANGVSPGIENLHLLRGDLETNRYKPSMQGDNMPPPPPTMMNPNQNVQDVSSKPLQVLPYDYKNTSTPNQPQENFNISASQVEPKTSNVEMVISDLHKVLENAKPELGEKKVSDIKKRILLMTSKWQNGELNCHVEDGMTKMAKCLLLAQVINQFQKKFWKGVTLYKKRAPAKRYYDF